MNILLIFVLLGTYQDQPAFAYSLRTEIRNYFVDNSEMGILPRHRHNIKERCSDIPLRYDQNGLRRSHL